MRDVEGEAETQRQADRRLFQTPRLRLIDSMQDNLKHVSLNSPRRWIRTDIGLLRNISCNVHEAGMEEA